MRILTSLAVGALSLLCCSVLTPQAQTSQPSESKKPEPVATKRLFIAEYISSGAVGSAHTDSSGNSYGSAAAVGRNISLEATDGFIKNCPVVTVTNDKVQMLKLNQTL